MKFLPYCSLILLLISLTMAHIRTKAKKKTNDDFATPSEPKIGPKGMPFNKTTSCETFGKYARFNPHSIIGVKWFVFYYWSYAQTSLVYEFRIPNKKEIESLHKFLDGHLPKRFNWSSTLVLQKELLTNETTLLEEKDDRGQYLEYAIMKGIPKGKITFFRKIRIRQTGDNKYLAIMDCKEHSAIVMSHLNAVPPQQKLQDEAARLGYRGRKGKSYLYQGHEWMPIPEQDEKSFWFLNRRLKDL